MVSVKATPVLQQFGHKFVVTPSEGLMRGSRVLRAKAILNCELFNEVSVSDGSVVHVDESAIAER